MTWGENGRCSLVEQRKQEVDVARVVGKWSPEGEPAIRPMI